MESRIDQQPGVRRGHTLARDAVDAVREFHAAVAQDDMVLVVFFCSSSYDIDRLGAEMKRAFAGIEVIGCTTAGEIGPAGYVAGSLCGMSFAAGQFTAVCGCIERLRQFEIAAGQDFGKDLLQRMGHRGPAVADDNTFALLLIDGMSVREEPVARAVQSVLGAIPLVGGSAASSDDAVAPVVYYGGRFAHDRAVVALLSTPLPVRLFETHHFVASDERLVVTEADTEARIVKEINGLPATEEYARRLGVAPHELGPEIFSASPVVVLIDGKSYVRAIHKANPDGSLTFFCAIENGLILRIAHTGDLYGKLAEILRADAQRDRSAAARHRQRVLVAACRGAAQRAKQAHRRSAAGQPVHRVLHLRRAIPRHPPQPDADRRGHRPCARRRRHRCLKRDPPARATRSPHSRPRSCASTRWCTP